MRKRNIACLAATAVFTLATFGCASHSNTRPAPAQVESHTPPAQATKPKSVILMIGDGMGISQITLARNYLHQGKGRLAMESFPVVGLVSTYSESNLVTDSAASATTLGSGVKVANKKIGLTPSGEEPRSLVDAAQAHGLKTGLVTTTEVTHATPAGFYGHVGNRYLRPDIDRLAEQLLSQNIDVVLGGGASDFLPELAYGNREDEKNLVDQARQAGYAYWDATTGLPDYQGEQKVMGLFAGSHLNYELDRLHLPAALQTPSLSKLSERALQVLDQAPVGFFLMIEGGRIDHAAHSFDAQGVIAEVQAFDQVVADLLEYQRQNPDVLLLLTADHATGGLAINDYIQWDQLTGQTASVDWLTAQIRSDDGVPTAEFIAKYAGTDVISTEDIAIARDISDKYDARRYVGRKLSDPTGVTWIPRVDNLETGGHTGEDVPIFAVGPGAERFGLMLDNTQVPKIIQELMGWPPLNPEM